MKTDDQRRFNGNPFSTRCIRPGEIPFRFFDGESCLDAEANEARFQTLIDTWAANSCIGQIVGPHGVGKTSLARAIAARTGDRFSQVESLVFRPASRWKIPWVYAPVIAQRHPLDQSDATAANIDRSRRLLLLDGVERLPRLQRAIMFAGVRRTYAGLMVTAHRPLHRIATIETMVPSPDVFLRLASELLESIQCVDEAATAIITKADMHQAYHAANENYREAFLQLYDRFESQVGKS